MSSKKQWVPWRNVCFRIPERADFAVWSGVLWVEIYMRPSADKWFRVVKVVPWRRWNQWSAPFRKELFVSFLDRLREARTKNGSPPMVQDGAFAKLCPALHEHMTATAFPDGEVRTPCSLTLFCEDGVFKACLSERDLDLTLWGTGETFQGALSSLEVRLASPNPDWRKKRPVKGKQRAQ